MKENKQVNPAVSSCTAEIVQKDGLAKGRNTRLGIHAGDGVDIVIAQSQRTGIVVFGCRKQVLAE